MSLLPSRSTGVDATQDGDLRVLGVDDDELASVAAALSSETSRAVLTAVYDEPGTATELADRTETSLQNALYHLEKLTEAGLIRVAETRYSAKGNEMSVYAPAEEPVVVFVGTETRRTSFLRALKRFLGAAALLALATLFVLLRSFGAPGGADADGAPPAGQPTGVEALPEFAAFFLGGAFVLALVALWWGWRYTR